MNDDDESKERKSMHWKLALFVLETIEDTTIWYMMNAVMPIDS